MCFGDMKNPNMKPRTGTDAGATGPRRAGTWEHLGKGGPFSQHLTAFSHFTPGISHLCPLKSTQVVDFPYMCNVSIFWGGAENSRISGRGIQAELGTKMGKWSAGVLEYWGRKKASGSGEHGGRVRICAKKVPDCWGKVHTDQGRGYAIVRIFTGGSLF